jgi:hypothetical protein
MFNSQNVIFYLRSQSRNSVTDDEHKSDCSDENDETETSTSKGLSEDELVRKLGTLSVENDKHENDDEINETETSTAIHQSKTNLRMDYRALFAQMRTWAKTSCARQRQVLEKKGKQRLIMIYLNDLVTRRGLNVGKTKT